MNSTSPSLPWSNIVTGRKILVRLARDGHHVADEDLIQRLGVEFARGRLVHRQNFTRDGISLQPLLDEINERHLLVACLAEPLDGRIMKKLRSEQPFNLVGCAEAHRFWFGGFLQHRFLYQANKPCLGLRFCDG